jgi:hypothetical protein
MKILEYKTIARLFSLNFFMPCADWGKLLNNKYIVLSAASAGPAKTSVLIYSAITERAERLRIPLFPKKTTATRLRLAFYKV